MSQQLLVQDIGAHLPLHGGVGTVDERISQCLPRVVDHTTMLSASGSGVLLDVLGDGVLDDVEVGSVRQVHPAVESHEPCVGEATGQLLPSAEPDQPVAAVVQHQSRNFDG